MRTALPRWASESSLACKGQTAGQCEARGPSPKASPPELALGHVYPSPPLGSSERLYLGGVKAGLASEALLWECPPRGGGSGGEAVFACLPKGARAGRRAGEKQKRTGRVAAAGAGGREE